MLQIFLSANSITNMFTYNYTVKFGDCDPAGILYFANIFKICHSAFEEFLIEKGISKDYFSGEELIFPLLSANAKYLRQIPVHSGIEIKVSTTDVRTNAFSLNYRVLGSGEILLADVETVHVCVNKSTGTKTNLPGYLTEAFKE